WSRSRWFPVLSQLARWGVIDLTVVERWARENSPAELLALEQEGVLRYLSWEGRLESTVSARWRAAYVVTNAAAHHSVIHTLLEESPNLRVIVCEKPCGEDINQALDSFDALHTRGVSLLMADHYLLRPGIQFLPTRPELQSSIGELVQITAAI